jgi:hypothetical protein
MTLNETLKQLRALGNEAARAHNAKWGADEAARAHNAKGCTSPFAPIWINAMVSRQGRANATGLRHNPLVRPTDARHRQYRRPVLAMGHRPSLEP